jgi:hypothetical protein
LVENAMDQNRVVPRHIQPGKSHGQGANEVHAAAGSAESCRELLRRRATRGDEEDTRALGSTVLRFVLGC